MRNERTESTPNWPVIIGLVGVFLVIVQISQAQISIVSNENSSAKIISLQETELAIVGTTPQTTEEVNQLQELLATVDAAKELIASVATQNVLQTQTAIAGTPKYSISQDNYTAATVAESIGPSWLLCITTGPITIKSSGSTLRFSGDGRASVVCWIGAQFAQASGLSASSSIKHVSISQGDSMEIALALVKQWAEEMTTRADGCGASYGPCYAADKAIVLADGSIVRP